MLSLQLFNAWELAEMEKDGCTREEKRQTRSGRLAGWHQERTSIDQERAPKAEGQSCTKARLAGRTRATREENGEADAFEGIKQRASTEGKRYRPQTEGIKRGHQERASREGIKRGHQERASVEAEGARGNASYLY
jgi:hypothetical protein